MSQPAAAVRPLGELLDSRRKFLLLNSLMLCMFISALDASIVATAIPHMLADLGGFHLLSWVFSIYLLASTVVVPIVGKLSDQFGRKPFILAGIAIFLAGSAVSGAAPTMFILILARGVQGIGGGILFGVVFTTLGDLYTPVERAKYMGYFISAFTLASLIGPTLGGFLTDGPGWRWCFYINLPIGAAASYFISRYLPYTRTGGRLADVDVAGAALLGGATISLLLALVWSNTAYGWSSPVTIGLLVLACALAVAFAFQEARHRHALLPLHLFRNRVFVQTNLISSIQNAGLFGGVQYLPTYIQVALGATATASGLVSTPQSVGVLVAGIFGGQLLSRTRRYKRQVIAGGLLVLGGALLLQRLTVNQAQWQIALYMVMLGVGSGLIQPTISVVVQACVTHDLIGVATSGRQFFAQIGQVLGVAVLGLVFTTGYSSALSSDLPTRARAQLSPETYHAFQDPTLGLDPAGVARVAAELRPLPDGEALLQEAMTAQRRAVTTAIDEVFLLGALSGVVVLVLSFGLQEIPLSDRFAVRSTASDEIAGIEQPAIVTPH